MGENWKTVIIVGFVLLACSVCMLVGVVAARGPSHQQELWAEGYWWAKRTKAQTEAMPHDEWSRQHRRWQKANEAGSPWDCKHCPYCGQDEAEAIAVPGDMEVDGSLDVNGWDIDGSLVDSAGNALILNLDRPTIPCPDGLPGCLGIHYAEEGYEIAWSLTEYLELLRIDEENNLTVNLPHAAITFGGREEPYVTIRWLGPDSVLEFQDGTGSVAIDIGINAVPESSREAYREFLAQMEVPNE